MLAYPLFLRLEDSISSFRKRYRVESWNWSSGRAGAPMIKPQIIEKDGKPEYAVIPVAEW